MNRHEPPWTGERYDLVFEKTVETAGGVKQRLTICADLPEPDEISDILAFDETQAEVVLAPVEYEILEKDIFELHNRRLIATFLDREDRRRHEFAENPRR